MLVSLLSFIALNNLLGAPTSTSSQKLEAFALNPPILESPYAYPEKTGTSLGPILDAKSILSIDLETGKILYQKNQDQELPMASLTKLMTVLVTLEDHAANEIVTVDPRATKVEPSKMDLLANEKISISELIKGIIVKSANDAALALAYHDSESVEDFVAKMNSKAAEIGMNHTHFVNPVGFDDPDQYSSSEDLATLARTVYKNPLIQQYAPLSKATASSTDGKFTHSLDTTNDLLSSYLKVIGLKTGTTDLAGQCLISIVVSPSGQKILNVMLHSSARFSESKILAQWIFDNYHWL